MSTSKEAQKRQRAARSAEKAMRRKRTLRIAWSGAAILLVAAIVVLIANRPPKPGEKVEIMADQTHIADVSSPHKPYNSDPPTSGQHVEYIAPWGVHQEPVAKEILVHNMEDGGVILYYNDKTDRATIDKLETIAKSYPRNVVVNPYPAMPNMITLTAWGRIDHLDSLDEERITAFIKAYKGIDHHPRK